MRKRMNIYITTSRNNLKYAYVSIKSLFINNQESEIFLYVVSEDLTLEDMKHEEELAYQFRHHIIILRFDEGLAKEYIHIKEGQHWPIGTMSSYWLFHQLLPEEVDRIMVIESDTVTIGSLSEIYHTNLEGYYAACPGPEHKPKNHRSFMGKIGGDCLTFVLSLYNVNKIREDFTLKDILKTDEVIKKTSGNSQMELTFGLLFHGKIKYIPGIRSCLDENIKYMEELGYDYIVDAESKVKLLHFSSYSNYSKPWNPVQIMPGYHIWWEYAQESPYYKEYFQEQWKIYNKTIEKQKKINKNITYRNLLLCINAIFFIMAAFTNSLLVKSYIGGFIVLAELCIAFLISIGLRETGIFIQKIKNRGV